MSQPAPIDGVEDVAADATVAASSSQPFSPHTRHSCCTFVSNFSDDQLKGTRAILSQVHPDTKISSSALIILMRLQDRIAHYLLERAYYKEESEWAKGRGYTFAAPVQIKTQSMIEPRSIGDCSSHSILWRFPSHIATGELGVHASAERIRHIEKLSNNWRKPENVSQPYLVFTEASFHRWLSDFAHGLTIRNEQDNLNINLNRSSSVDSTNLVSSLPDEMTNYDSCVGLLAMIEYITAEILELAGSSARDRQVDHITPQHMLPCIMIDEELKQLLLFLPIDWSIGPRPQQRQQESAVEEEGWSTSADSLALLVHTHRGSDNAYPKIDTLLRTEFANELESSSRAHKENDQASWYNNQERIQGVAQKIVRDGTIDYSPIARSLQQYHTRAYCYWGERTDESIWASVSQDLERWPSRYTYTTIIVTDAADHDWPFLLELVWSESDQVLLGTIFAQNTFDDPISIKGGEPVFGVMWRIGKFDINHREIEIECDRTTVLHRTPPDSEMIALSSGTSTAVGESSAAATEPTVVAAQNDAPVAAAPNTNSSAATGTITTPSVLVKSTLPYLPHGLAIGETPLAPVTRQILAASSSVSSTSVFSPLAAIRIDVVNSISFETRHEGESYKRESAVQKELECIIPHVLHIVMNHDQYSSSLYIANQPLAARRRFTHALIDESFIHAAAKGDSTLMPSVLIDLITEYHAVELPHLAEEMIQPSVA